MESTNSQDPELKVSPETTASNDEINEGGNVDEIFASETETLDRLKNELQEAQQRELRALAELDNVRKRLQRDYESLIKFASMGLVRDLVEVIDNMNRACESAASQASVAALLEGVRMVQGQMVSVLAKYDCKPIEAVGKEFDPNIHQAIAQMPSTEHAAGLVMNQASVGYMMHDRVVRPSQVIVSTGS